VFFTKATTAVAGPHADIPFDANVSTQMDWEVELGVVIGKAGKNIPRDRAFEHVFGYTVINDVSARDIQNSHGGQFFKGKSLDGACPMGPWIVTRDEIPDPHALPLRCRVNGVVKQESNTSDFIFDIPALIEWLSKGMTLLPGDVIATGTPSGVGFARTPPEFLKPGDVVECEVEGIGTIRNRVVAV
jgi:2-keto-4-pentenoate hydratase/2-oxohepta-3-ene-1,7-dioic acid hydratase in catechol pathway